MTLEATSNKTSIRVNWIIGGVLITTIIVSVGFGFGYYLKDKENTSLTTKLNNEQETGIIVSTKKKRTFDDKPDDHNRVYCTILPKTPGDRRSNKAGLKIVHLNARFAINQEMKDTLCNEDDEKKPYCKSWVNDDEHLKLAGRLLATYDADIYNVCEVLDCQSLENMRLAMPNADQYWVYYPKQKDNTTLQGCGLITRVDPIAPVLSMDSSLHIHAPLPNSICPNREKFPKSLSKGVHAMFNINDIPIAFFGLHLLAQPTNPDRCNEREAQAALVAHEVTGGQFAQVTSKTYNLLSDEQRKNMEVIVVGDMNDYDFRVVNGKKETLNAYEKSPSEVTLHPITEAVGMIREGSSAKTTFSIGAGKKKTSKSVVIGDLKKQFEGIGLQNVLWLEQNPWNRRTFSDVVNSKTVKFSVLDHMLLSPNLYKSTVYAQAGATFKNYMLRKEVQEMKEKHQKGWEGKDYCTDHYAVWAQLDLDYLKKYINSKTDTERNKIVFNTFLPNPIESIPDFANKDRTSIPTCQQYVEQQEKKMSISQLTDTLAVERF